MPLQNFIFLLSASITVSQSADKFHFLFNVCVFVVSFPLLHTSLTCLYPPFMEATWHRERNTQFVILDPVLLSWGILVSVP